MESQASGQGVSLWSLVVVGSARGKEAYNSEVSGVMVLQYLPKSQGNESCGQARVRRESRWGSEVGNGKGFDFKVVNVYIFNLTKIKISAKSYPKSGLGVQFFL